MSHWDYDPDSNLGDALGRVGNRWARLESGFKLTLQSLGAQDTQIEKILSHVKAGDFSTLEKLLKR